MKRLKRQPSLWICCTLLVLPFIMTSPSYAQCTMTSGQLDAALASCGEGEGEGVLDCFVSLAKGNAPCAANIAWYYMIVYAPEDPTVVRDRFRAALPYSLSLSEDLRVSISAAYRANRNEQQAGSKTSANEYPYGQGSRSADEQPYGK